MTRPLPEKLTDPQAEDLRDLLPPNLDSPKFWAAFLQRTRRYHRLTRAAQPARVALGMQSNLEDLA